MSGPMHPAPRWSLAALSFLLLVGASPALAGSPQALLATMRLEKPSITAQPADQAVLVGQRATFRVTAKGTPPLLYQWKKNGRSIRGALSASYTTPAATLADDGANFTVEVRSLLGKVTSRAATLRVSPPPVAPTLATAPQDQVVVEGQPAPFGVAATGTAPLAYQWSRGGAAIPGATAASYTTPATSLGDSGATFTVTVTNVAGAVTSAPATLTVKPAPRPPSITAAPHDQVITEGDAATFTVAATGDEPLAYQWSRDGAAIAGAVAASYTTPTLTRADDGATFTVTVTNAVGSATTAPVTLHVEPRIETATLYQAGVLADGWAPQLWSGCSAPDPLATFAGRTVLSFDLTCDSGWDAGVLGHWSSTFDLSPYDTLSFDIGSDAAAGMDTLVIWFQDAKTIPVGPLVPGQLNHVIVALGDLALPGSAINQFGWFSATPSAGPHFYLDNVAFSGSAGPTAPSIVAAPADQTVAEGERATFSVLAAGTGPLAYQWSKDGTPIPGASSRSYTTGPTAAADSGARYTVTVTNAVGGVTSAPAVLTVQAGGGTGTTIPCTSDCGAVTFTVDVARGPTERAAGPLPVSPYVYGVNPASGDLDRTTRWGLLRAGGNAYSAWNWTNNYRNSGADYCFWQGLANGGSGPAADVSWIPTAGDKGIASLITLPIGDYVSARVDNQTWPACNSVPGSTNVNEIPFAPSSYFVANRPTKGGAFCAYPGPAGEAGDCAIDPNAGVVYQDEFVNYLKRWWVDGSGATVFLELDNEPNYWMGTHPELWSNPKLTYEEAVTRDRTYAAAVKAAWPEAKVFGPVVAQDGIVFAHDYTRQDEFLDYYLPQMSGLLDVLDVHYYNNSTDPATCLQNPRAFWDPAYTVPNNQDGMDYIVDLIPDYAHRRMIPRLLEKIDAAHMSPAPGLAFTEYDSGCEGDIAGGVAQAEALGLFGRYGVYAANAWFVGRNTASDYAGVAFDAYRNYDGAGATVGDLAVAAATSDDVDTSVYAFTHAGDPARVELVALNKTTASIPVHATIATPASFTGAQVYRLVRSGTVAVTPAPGAPPAVRCDGASCALDYVLEPLSVATIVLR